MADKKQNGKKRGKKRIAVIGIGRFGSNLARELYDQGHDVLAIDTNEDAIQDIKGSVSYAVTGDATNSEVMRELGVHEFDVGIVAIGGDEKASIMATVLLCTFDIRVFARAHNILHADTLELLGCERVIRVEDEMGQRVAENFDRPDFQHFDLDKGHVMAWIAVPQALNGDTVAEAGFNKWESPSPEEGGANGNGDQDKQKKKDKKGDKEEGLRLLLIKRSGSGQPLVWAPSQDERFEGGDWIAVSGPEDEIEALISD